MFDRVSGAFSQRRQPRRPRCPFVDDRGIGVGSGTKPVRAAEAFRPGERIGIVLEAQHRRRVDGDALEDLFQHLAVGLEAQDLRDRPWRIVAFETIDRARRKDEHAVRGFSAQDLLPRVGQHIDFGKIDMLREHRRGRIAHRQPAAIARNPVRIGNAHAARRAIPGENDVPRKIGLAEIRQRTPVRVEACAGPRASAPPARPSARCGRRPPRRTHRPRAAPRRFHMAISKAPVSEPGTSATS